MIISLKGKTAIVCGSSQGIGQAIAVQFAEMGANVILVARNEELLRECLQSLKSSRESRHSYICTDFQDPLKAIENIKIKTNDYKDIQILVNNSGGPKPGPAHNSEVISYKNAFEQHIIMSQLLTQLLIPSMKSHQYGRIINIVSIGAKQPIDNLGVSNTIRAAMVSWAKTISKELGPFGITVNNILPGYTKTGRLDSLIENIALNSGKTSEEIENGIISKIPAGRLGEPRELAYLAGFLASDYAGYINGTSIPVDGGYLSCL